MCAKFSILEASLPPKRQITDNSGTIMDPLQKSRLRRSPLVAAFGTSLLAVSLFLNTSCSENEGETQQTMGSAIAERDSLIRQILEATELFDEVDESLSSIGLEVQSFQVAPEDGQLDRQASIREKLKRIGDAVAEQRRELERRQALIDELSANNKASKNTIRILTETKTRLQELLDKRERRILELEDMVATLTVERDSALALAGEARAERDAAMTAAERLAFEKGRIQEEKLRLEKRAWYIIGTEKELKEKGFEWYNKGFLGIGGNLLPNTGMDKDRVFTLIEDIDDRENILLPGELEKIHSAHEARSSSWTYDKEKRILKITDPRSFWQGERYLIVEVSD